MTAIPPHRRDASTLAQQLHQREITAESVVGDCLGRIADREPVVRAWTHLNRDNALRRARVLDRGPVTGLLHGLPVGIKDIMDTHDMPTAYGSAIYAGHQPGKDAAVVALTRESGAVLLGKTVTTEFAIFHPGPTTNPHNALHTPGGSSSGSAAAVADFMVPLALGSQTGGSIIRPAAYCGVVGYKPSFNTLPRAGIQSLADSLDTIGPIARNVRDAALFAAAASGLHDLVLPAQCTERPTVGLCRTWEWDYCETSQQMALEQAGALLLDAAFPVVELTLPVLFKKLADAHFIIMLRQQYQSLTVERLNHWESLSQNLRNTLERGAAISDTEFLDAWQLILSCKRIMKDVFADVDVLLVPSVTGEAPEGLGGTGNPIMNRIWTALHGPAITLPFGRGPRNLPTGVTVAGMEGHDRDTLLAAQSIESALAPGQDRRFP